MKDFAMSNLRPESGQQQRHKPSVFYAFVAFCGGLTLFVIAIAKLNHASRVTPETTISNAKPSLRESLVRANRAALPMEFRLQALLQAEREIARQADPDQARKTFGQARTAIQEISSYYPERTPEQQRLYIVTLERVVEWGWLAGGEATSATSNLLTQLADERNQLHITR